MIIARIRTPEGTTEDNLYRNLNDLAHCILLRKATILDVLRLEVCGKTYAERKEHLRAVAICFQAKDDGESDIQLSMSERGIVEAWFCDRAGRYGLVQEFEENGII